MQQSRLREIRQNLLKLSHELGREDRHLAILGEGNTSARVSEKTFLVKASGTNLGTLQREDVVECETAAIMPLLDKPRLSDAEIEHALLDSRVDSKAKKPSVETLFHAYLLSLPGIGFVGHTHPLAVMRILCSPRAKEFAAQRLFPDEVVRCGAASVYVPYTDPGLRLAQAIRRSTERFIKKTRRQPQLIVLENHGIIALGGSWQAVLAATLMAEKAAAIWLGAALLGGPNPLSLKQVERIAGRPDELYRQRALNI